MANLTEPARFDPDVAHPARVYSYWMGSKDHYPADRKVAEEVAACRPQVVAGARANRAFLARCVRYLAGQRGVRQFLHIGPGLPAPPATHEVAQAIAPQSKIVYVDYADPPVMAHARALLTSRVEGVCDYVQAGLRDPGAIVGEARNPQFHPAARRAPHHRLAAGFAASAPAALRPVRRACLHPRGCTP